MQFLKSLMRYYAESMFGNGAASFWLPFLGILAMGAMVAATWPR